MNRLVVYTDGGARGNPGRAAVGIAIKTENREVLKEISRTIGVTTNNVAEYEAVVAALEWLRNNLTMKQFNNETIIQFYLDSTLVVNQLNGKFKVKDSELRELLLKVRMLEQEVGGQIYYATIPREKNGHADALVNRALDNVSGL
ncbi:ribonuclease HI family protein [Candidatus Gottesmanbacteria bacterium]|nr:ribonuclease HI family protein [Candidatus Gottesmanbacteria bacterium]